MKRCPFLFYLCLIIFSCLSDAQEPTENGHHRAIAQFLEDIFNDNSEYVSEISHEHFQSFAEQQTPRATVIACSDSRVQANAFHRNPINDLFFIRNIGNQIKTTEGSVEYGIYHLHTPVLLIIGHSHCGAISAALGDYSNETDAIQRELSTLDLKKAIDVNEGVEINIHQQVDYALSKFKDLVVNKNLIVVGALYDFRNDFGYGHGKLILINLNGEQNPTEIKKNAYVKGISTITIGR